MDNFTCKDCGGHDLIVKYYFTNVQSVSETQECICGNSENGLAYEKNYKLFTPHVEFSFLDEDHHFNEEASDYGYDLEEELDDPEEGEDAEVNIYCENCFDSNQECIVEDDPEGNEIIDEEFFVICANCKREIEFGWSHPDRGGRIWPSECKDFNPWKCWPEPRYKQRWAEKNWLRPMTVEQH